MNTFRKIIHVDMDAFYASVEQRDNPGLRGKPVVVGNEGERGVVAAASYEARKYGIHSAMPSLTARKKCPDLIFVKGRHPYYKEVSREIFQVFYEYTHKVEPLSIDEAFLDVTENKKKKGSATLIAREIKNKIREKTQLTASAGISVNKFLAKLASDMEKPDGLTVITPDRIEGIISNLPIEKFYGIGKVTAARMRRLGITNGLELRQKDLPFLITHFGKAGQFFYDMARGKDLREVESDRLRKSVSTEVTYRKDLVNQLQVVAELYHLEQELMRRMSHHNAWGRTLTLKVKFHDFKQITRSVTHTAYIRDFRILHEACRQLRQEVDFEGKKVRLLGLGVSNLESEEERNGYQMTLDF